MKQRILPILALLLMAVTGAWAADEVLIDFPTSEAGTAVSGTTAKSSVKVNMNTTSKTSLQLKNGFTTDGAYNSNAIVLTVDGGFKQGDVITIAGAINNADASKRATAKLFTVDASNNISVLTTFSDFVNGQKVETMPVEESYTLTADAETLYLGRDGNTAAHLTMIKVVRPVPVLYAEVSGTAMTLKYGAKPDGATAYDGTYSWAGSFRDDITTATVEASCQSYTGTSLAYLFFAMIKLGTINGLENLNTTNVTDMTQMFASNAAMTSLDLSTFNTAAATSLSGMFYNCQKLASLDLSSFNTAKVTDMYAMFCYCSKLTSVDLSSFNTAAVTNLSAMFSGCSALTSLDLSSFNTANVTDMGYMFENCSALTTITVGDGWSTEAVTSSSSMFYNCTSLTNFDESNIGKTNAHTGTGGYLTAAAPALQPYYVTLADGTEDAANWQAKVGEGEFTVLPVTGLEGGETVTIQYNGTRRIKSITAVQKVPVTAITLNKTETLLGVGNTETLSVSSVTPADATDQTVTWSSDNEAVATVNATTGEVTAVAAGTANITATANDGSGVKGNCAVKVTALAGVFVNGATLKMNNFKFKGSTGHSLTITYNGTGFTASASGVQASMMTKTVTVNGKKITVQCTDGLYGITWVFDTATDHYTYTASGSNAEGNFSNASSFLLKGTDITSLLTKD